MALSQPSWSCRRLRHLALLITYAQSTPKEARNFGRSRYPQNFAARRIALHNHANPSRRSNYYRCLQRRQPDHHDRKENLDREHSRLAQLITYVQTTPKETNRASYVPSQCLPTQTFGEIRSPQSFAARGMALQLLKTTQELLIGEGPLRAKSKQTKKLNGYF